MDKSENKYYKMLDFFEDNDNNEKKDGKLKLTRNNADFIETVLGIDSNYKNAGNPNKEPSVDYVEYLETKNINEYNGKLHEYGSGDFWINKLIEIIESNDKNSIVEITLKYEKGEKKGKSNEKIKLNLETILKGVVCAIDRENSTHLTAHQSKKKVGRSNVSNRIYKYIEDNGIENFKKKLIEEDDFYLIGYITVPSNNNEENYHYSFATKFCKYISLNMNPKCDKYYIYDNIIISNITYYIEKYGLKEKYNKKMLEFDKKNIKSENDEEKYIEIANQYKRLYECLDEIREIANTEDKGTINKNEMDHIIWYFNK